MLGAVLCLALAGNGCTDRNPTTASQATDTARSWWQWHDDKRTVDTAVTRAINEPGGGDYAKAADAVRQSSFPPDVKQFQIGQLIIDGFSSAGATRPPETLEQGLRMVEDATTMGGEMERHGPQQLRMMFERGIGIAPNAIPVTPQIAACWYAVERRQSTDRARCIALRRRLLPRVGA